MANRGRPAKEFKGATAPLKNTATIEEVIEEAPKVSERQFTATIEEVIEEAPAEAPKVSERQFTATIEEVIEEAPAEAPKVSERQFIATNRRETQRLYPEGKVFTTSEIVALGHHPLMLVHRGIIRQL